MTNPDLSHPTDTKHGAEAVVIYERGNHRAWLRCDAGAVDVEAHC